MILKQWGSQKQTVYTAAFVPVSRGGVLHPAVNAKLLYSNKDQSPPKAQSSGLS